MLIIFDLDGTLANIEHRVHLVRRDRPDFEKFYSLCNRDGINHWCRALIQSMQWNYEVKIVTARPAKLRNKTMAWLKSHFSGKIPEVIFVRPDGNSDPDQELKRRWLRSYGGPEILFVVDDRQKVVDMWREEGLVCLQSSAWKEWKREK